MSWLCERDKTHFFQAPQGKKLLTATMTKLQILGVFGCLLLAANGVQSYVLEKENGIFIPLFLLEFSIFPFPTKEAFLFN